MVGNSIAESFLLSHKSPGHKGGTFEGAMLAAVLGLGTIVLTITVDGGYWVRLVVFFTGALFSIACGTLLTRMISKRRAKRRAEFENEYRAEQERETQRKLAEAKARGDI